MEEFKTVYCDSGKDANVIQFWVNNFGWELVSTQEVDKVDVDFDNSTDTLTKTSYNYIKVTFKRDTNRPNHSELARLEKEYLSVPDNVGYYLSKKGIVWFFILATICFPLGFLMTLSGVSDKNTEWLIIGLVFLVLFALFIFLAIFKIKKNKNDLFMYKKHNSDLNEKRRKIIKEAFDICQCK